MGSQDLKLRGTFRNQAIKLDAFRGEQLAAHPFQFPIGTQPSKQHQQQHDIEYRHQRHRGARQVAVEGPGPARRFGILAFARLQGQHLAAQQVHFFLADIRQGQFFRQGLLALLHQRQGQFQFGELFAQGHRQRTEFVEHRRVLGVVVGVTQLQHQRIDRRQYRVVGVEIAGAVGQQIAALAGFGIGYQAQQRAQLGRGAHFAHRLFVACLESGLACLGSDQHGDADENGAEVRDFPAPLGASAGVHGPIFAHTEIDSCQCLPTGQTAAADGWQARQEANLCASKPACLNSNEPRSRVATL